MISLEPDNRYSRQILFRGIGADGQKRLSGARVAIVGCGATGSALASLLARSGVGKIRIIDRDYVEASNLQRQTLFDESDAAESLPKAVAAGRKIAAFNSEILIEPQVADLTPENISSLLADVSLILDGTDNFETRYLVNDYAVKNSLPWIYTAAVGSYGVTMNILPNQTACLTCMFPEPPGGILETCDTAGILNSAVNLACSTSSVNVLCNFDFGSVTPSATAPATAILTLTTTSATTGLYAVTVTGTNNSQSRSASYSLTLTDFSLSATPSTGSISAANSS